MNDRLGLFIEDRKIYFQSGRNVRSGRGLRELLTVEELGLLLG
jgi:hypothetical protein